jgi:hypothetical protein
LKFRKKIADEIAIILAMRKEALKTGERVVKETESFIGQLS